MPVRIVEGKLPYTGGTGIEITSDKVINLLLREENNLIMVNDDNEVYTDLQLESGLTPSSDFPVGVTVGKVLQTDGWTQNGLILNWKTTSGDYARWIYANDGKIYFDGGNGTWQRVYYSSEVDTLLTNLRNEVYQYFMKWSDFERDEQNNANVILSLTTETTPTADFTVSAPTTVRTGQEYVLRVNSVDTAYVMTLGTGIVNPKLVNTNLHAHISDVFVFLALDDGTLELQPVVEPGATANDGVLTIQKNGTTVATFTANQGTNTTANITVPTVVDDLTTQSSINALSANQGYLLKGMIDDLAGFGKFLSLWNATTGMPISFPLATPYTYSTGDYFVVEVVSSATPPVNYRPNGSSYTGTASSTAETDELEVGDVYVYDGSVRLLQSNHGKTVSFANIAGDPYDNTNLATALGDKQDVLTAGANITIDPLTNEISASNTTYSSATSTTAGIVKLGSDTVISETIQSPAGATNKTYPVQLNSSGQMGVNVPRANTTYSAGTGISINGSNAISNTGVTSVNGSTGAVTVTEANDSTIIITQGGVTKGSFTTNQSSNSTIALDAGKVYTAGTNIDITEDVISVKMSDTIYNTQGPCYAGYHIPSQTELTAVNTFITAAGPDSLYLPIVDGLSNSTGNPTSSVQGYWSCKAHQLDNTGILLSIYLGIGEAQKAYGLSIRPFKDKVISPDGLWTTIYESGNNKSYHNSSLGLISFTIDNGTTRYTIADKNLGATTIWTGGALADTAKGNCYQRGNCYGFANTGATTTSATQVNTSGYGPGNRYSSSTFITASTNWSSVQNDNLRGGRNPISIQSFITNDTTGTTTTVSAIRAGTEAEFALITPTSGVEYHVYPN